MKKLILGIACLTLLLSLGCTTGSQTNQQEAKYVQVELGKEFQLPIGQTAFIASENFYIQFLETTENSLCPEDVQCFWSGEATAKLSV